MKKVEMHCHILPGIDDGAEDMKQSLQMLHIAMEHEIVGAIVTPHGSARDASRERTEKIRKLCKIFRIQEIKSCKSQRLHHILQNLPKHPIVRPPS